MRKVTLFFALILSFSFCNKLDAQDWRLFFGKTQIDKYRPDNEKLGPPKKDEFRVVFMGNSITEFWPNLRPVFFSNRGYIGRGISGQTTAQMLLRFRTDVISLQPKVVVILAGINDIAENAGPISIGMIAENIMTMAELASYHGIEVIICSVVPAIDFPWNPGMEPAEKVVELNGLLKAYATQNNFTYVDYHSAMKDDKNGLKVPDYTAATDLVHPNEAGYMVMESLVQPEIESVRTRILGSKRAPRIALKKCKFKKKKVIVEFEKKGSDLEVKGESLEGFEIAGADGNFTLAQAQIVGKKVKVWSPKIKNPQFIRYSWSDETIGNLFDKTGRAVASFNTKN